MRKRSLCLLLALLLTACVPTPEEDAVRQKDTEQLISAVVEAEERQSGGAAEAAPLSAALPQRFTADFSTATRGVHALSDVPIRVRTNGASFPVLRVTHRYLTDAERLAVCRRLLGADTLYVWTLRPRTREDVTREMQAHMNALDFTPESKAAWLWETDSTEQDWEQMQKTHRDRLTELQAEYNALPESVGAAPNPVWDGSIPEDNPSPADWNAITVVANADQQDISTWQYDQVGVEEASRDHVLAYLRHRSVEEMEGGSDSFHAELPDSKRIDPAEYDTPQDGADISARDAIALVQSMLGDAAAHYEAADVWWSNNAYHDGDATGVFDRWGYLVRLTPVFSGAQAVFCDAEASDGGDDFPVNRSWPYDRVEASVQADGTLLALTWYGALTVTEPVADSAPLLPFDEVQSLFAQQMNRVFGREEHTSGTVTVADVQLGLFRIRERNHMDNGLFVPAWFFTGTFTYADAQQTDWRTEDRFDSFHPLLVLNAIDGSVIDPVQGY